MTSFGGCRFEGLGWLEVPGDENDEIEKIEIVSAYRAATTPVPLAFRVEQIIGVTAED